MAVNLDGNNRLFGAMGGRNNCSDTVTVIQGHQAFRAGNGKFSLGAHWGTQKNSQKKPHSRFLQYNLLLFSLH